MPAVFKAELAAAVAAHVSRSRDRAAASAVANSPALPPRRSLSPADYTAILASLTTAVVAMIGGAR